MNNRSNSIFIAVIAVLLFLFPGIAGICLGMASLVDAVFGFGIFGNDLNTYLWYIFGGICGGFLFLVISVIMIIIAVQKGRQVSLPPAEPTPPGPDEGLPPTL